MANNWNIPEWLEKEVKKRDKVCVYCGVEFTSAKASKRRQPVGSTSLMTQKSLQRKISLFAALDAMPEKVKSSFRFGCNQNTARSEE
jgi:hypothetical protein